MQPSTFDENVRVRILCKHGIKHMHIDIKAVTSYTSRITPKIPYYSHTSDIPLFHADSISLDIVALNELVSLALLIFDCLKARD